MGASATRFRVKGQPVGGGAAAKQEQTTEIERLAARLRDDQLEANRRPAKLTPEQYDRIITVLAVEIVAADSSS
jgi:hypothetical protein